MPIRMSSLPVGEARQSLPDLGGLAKARDHLDLDREVRQALAEGAEVLLGEDRGRNQHHHLLAVRDGLVRGAQRDLGLAVADVAADQPVHRALRLQVGLHRLDRLELVGGLAVGEGALEHQLPLAVGREGVAAASPALGVEVEQLPRQLARGAAGARLDALPARRAQRRELRRLAPGADVAGDLGQLVGGREDAVVAPVAQLQVVAGDPGDGLRLEAGEAGDPVVLVDDVVAHPQVGEGRQATARRGRSGRPAPVHQAAEGDHRELQVGRDEAVGERRLGEQSSPRAPPARAAPSEKRRVEAIQVVAGPLGLATVLERDDDAVAGAKLLLELGLRLADAARGGGGRLSPERTSSCPDSVPLTEIAARSASGSATST